MTLLNVPLPPQPLLDPPTSSLIPVWGKAAPTATSAVQEMSVVKSDKEKDAGKLTHQAFEVSSVATCMIRI